MFTEKHKPTFLPQEALDVYLEKAWYRLGQHIFTTNFMFVEGQLYSPIWLRMPLKSYNFRKGLRKILKRNDQLFKTIIRPFEIGEEQRALYQVYRDNFKGLISVTLEAYLQDGLSSNIFNSYEIAIYEGDQLIASSVFDIGNKSLASIMGMFHPDYSKYSMGFYTMLLEIRYGLERDFDFYYPGYFVPGRPRFDYKLRIGKKEEVQFYHLKEKSWKPMTTYSQEAIPVIKLIEKLGNVRLFFDEKSIASQLLYCPGDDRNETNFLNPKYLESPIFLHCQLGETENERYIVIYDFWEDQFVFFQLTKKRQAINFFGKDKLSPLGEEETLYKEEIVKKVLLKSVYAFAIANKVEEIRSSFRN